MSNLSESFLELDEKIGAGVIFGPKTKIKPLWFWWRGRKYQVKKITYIWKTKKGKATLYHFAVIDENDNLFELCYNSESLVWRVLSSA